ncbi:hypothetical protein [Rhodothermus profundi]|uniref:Uncharacterized protein n=1 Tax=Rhodothermus profundi TaxID=633813 RepID=A0A1M6RMM3_9BACT|nr:hypothetical protein [Rhodothermus profundi]SHK33723.1 hypothetical protein SAMN04488087_0906 [Rhodothermus profundi]
MLVLFRRAQDPIADDIEEQLRELVLAHRVVRVDKAGRLPDGTLPTAWPVLVEGRSARYEGAKAIRAFLEELAHEVRLNRQFQADACYLDPDDPSCCL